MPLTRRATLGLVAAGLATSALDAAPRVALPSTLSQHGGDAAFGKALAAIRACAEAELRWVGLPGMTLSVVGPGGATATLCLGWADKDARVPVRPDHLFEIGSISKSLTGLWIHAAADHGRLRLDDPIEPLLPGVPLPSARITIAHLLNHAAGLAHDAPIFPRTPDGRLWSGFEPGSRMSYSNTGYNLLGEIIDRLTGRPHAQVLKEEILAPLGMRGAAAHLSSLDRARYAVGYTPLIDDMPALTRTRLAPGPWTQEDMAAGSVAASAEAMIGYLRYVLALGSGRGGPVMSNEAAKRLLAMDIKSSEFGPGARYASGLATVPIDGRPALHHTGGMLLFSSSFHADPAAGVGCFASVNAAVGEYRPRKTTAYAVQVLRALKAGAIPPPPDAGAYNRVERPDLFVGRYLGPGSELIEIRREGAGLRLVSGGVSGRVEQLEGEVLMTDHPHRSRHLLDFMRRDGKVVALWWGDQLFGRDNALPQPSAPDHLKPLAGRYVGRDPWAGSVSIVVRGDAVVAEGLGRLVKREGGFWSLEKDPGGVDRFWFDEAIDGRPSRFSISGADLFRVT